MSRKSKSFIVSLTLLNFLLTNCAPNLIKVKEESALARELPQTYPSFEEAQPVENNTAEQSEAQIKESQESGEATPEEKTGEEQKPVDEIKPVQETTKAPVKIENWQEFFANEELVGLIQVALENNQELKIMTEEINIADNEVLARRGEYLPKVGLGAEGGMEKVGEYTTQGVSDANDQYEPGERVPEKLPIYSLGLKMSWEVDIWKKLRNASKSAALQYLASIDGRNFMITRLVAEIASTYYELLALDKQFEIVQSNVDVQQQALELVRLQKEAARVTSLAVRRFEAEVLKNRSHLYELKQSIVQTENRLNLLLGRFPQPIARNSQHFTELNPVGVESGVPSQLLNNRPDVLQAERKLEAAKLDVKVARARFYPSLSIEGGVGYESFNSKHLFQSPESVFYNIAGNLTAPLLNRRGIKADYYTANSKQIQAVYDYEKTLIHAYTEVVNQLSMINNMKSNYGLKRKQVEALDDALEVSNILFKAARADYVEVLMTRRDALEAQMELVEIKKQQLISYVKLYLSLGGGWQKIKLEK